MSTRFEARWPIEPGTEAVPFTARVRVAKRDLDQLLEEKDAELLCHPDALTWTEDDGELVATGPARRKTTTTRTATLEAA